VGFCALVLWWLIFFSATKTRKHGITPKDLNQQASVGFGALVAILFRHGNTEALNCTKRYYNEGFGGL
jgi:hypothetical protein